ncbi:hypothetical protein PoB_003368400 [Plakobranchus ocellatus]|uniref:Secreted protein n=1 Tax=Plakobranchus ocellatus TaxID=259542 RepID=A0AAV4ALG2_9GAST|nr:hypothetical protein PoB_003368400 [Plakobranchus ocellatus]
MGSNVLTVGLVVLNFLLHTTSRHNGDCFATSSSHPSLILLLSCWSSLRTHSSRIAQELNASSPNSAARLRLSAPTIAMLHRDGERKKTNGGKHEKSLFSRAQT